MGSGGTLYPDLPYGPGRLGFVLTVFLEVLGSPTRPKELISLWKVRIELRILYLFMDMEVSFNNVHVPMNND